MKLDSTYSFAAPPARVWEAICDPQTLKQCIPQCEEVVRLDDTHWRGTAIVKISLVKVTFEGLMSLSDIIPGEAYTLTIVAKGWVGTAHGSARVILTPSANGGTLLSYSADVHIGIKLLDKAMNLAHGIAKDLADAFFGRLAALLSPKAPT